MFWQNTSTDEYMLEVVELFNLGNSTDWSPDRPRSARIALARGYLTDAKRGGNHIGTWTHPKLAVFFARWLNAKFAVWRDMQIDDILRGGRPDPFKGPTELPTHPRPIRIPVTREEHFNHMEAYRKEMLAMATQRVRCFLPSAPSGLTIRHPMGAIVDAQYRGS